MFCFNSLSSRFLCVCLFVWLLIVFLFFFFFCFFFCLFCFVFSGECDEMQFRYVSLLI